MSDMLKADLADERRADALLAGRRVVPGEVDLNAVEDFVGGLREEFAELGPPRPNAQLAELLENGPSAVSLPSLEDVWKTTVSRGATHAGTGALTAAQQRQIAALRQQLEDAESTPLTMREIVSLASWALRNAVSQGWASLRATSTRAYTSIKPAAVRTWLHIVAFGTSLRALTPSTVIQSATKASTATLAGLRWMWTHRPRTAIRRVRRVLLTKLAALSLVAKAGIFSAAFAATTTSAAAVGALPDVVQDRVATVVAAVTPFEIPRSTPSPIEAAPATDVSDPATPPAAPTADESTDTDAQDTTDSPSEGSSTESASGDESSAQASSNDTADQQIEPANPAPVDPAPTAAASDDPATDSGPPADQLPGPANVGNTPGGNTPGGNSGGGPG
ncbi:MAG: hypothetical protein WD358_07175, partial [Nitriliruptoraceae bacterium]